MILSKIQYSFDNALNSGDHPVSQIFGTTRRNVVFINFLALKGYHRLHCACSANSPSNCGYVQSFIHIAVLASLFLLLWVRNLFLAV